jgi:hypothetical protein
MVRSYRQEGPSGEKAGPVCIGKFFFRLLDELPCGPGRILHEAHRTVSGDIRDGGMGNGSGIQVQGDAKLLLVLDVGQMMQPGTGFLVIGEVHVVGYIIENALQVSLQGFFNGGVRLRGKHLFQLRLTVRRKAEPVIDAE